MKKSTVSVLLMTSIVATAFSTGAFALESKQARKNDVVKKYVLDGSSFFRMMERSGKSDLRCDITTGVSDFKVSQHPEDAATAYFIKDGDLHYVKNTKKDVRAGNCPSADTGRLMGNVKKHGGKWEYGVISNTETEYVNYGLSGSGKFLAWKNSGNPMEVSDVTDVVNNSCFGSKGKHFSKSILFLQKRNGDVISMESDGDTKNQGSYESIQKFKAARDVCEDAS